MREANGTDLTMVEAQAATIADLTSRIEALEAAQWKINTQNRNNGTDLHTNWLLAVLELQLLFREVHEVGVGWRMKLNDRGFTNRGTLNDQRNYN